jgi:hypothetical protein
VTEVLSPNREMQMSATRIAQPWLGIVALHGT